MALSWMPPSFHFFHLNTHTFTSVAVATFSLGLGSRWVLYIFQKGGLFLRMDYEDSHVYLPFEHSKLYQFDFWLRNYLSWAYLAI